MGVYLASAGLGMWAKPTPRLDLSQRRIV